MAIILVISFFCLTWFQNWEYSWIFRSITGGYIGYACAYLWIYEDLKTAILKHIKIINEVRDISKS